MTETRIRVLLGKIGLDGHDRGLRMMAAWLRQAGMEVVYVGTHLAPQAMASAAVEEDVDVIGLSFQGADHVPMMRQMMEQIKERQLEDRLLIIGGNIPKRDIPVLRDMGVDQVFPSGTPVSTSVSYIEENARSRREAE